MDESEPKRFRRGAICIGAAYGLTLDDVECKMREFCELSRRNDGLYN